jgi:hypothetical protein
MSQQENETQVIKWTRDGETNEILKQWALEKIGKRKKWYFPIFIFCGIFGLYMGYFQMHEEFLLSLEFSLGIIALLFFIWYGGKLILVKTPFLLPKKIEVKIFKEMVGIKIEAGEYYKVQSATKIGETQNNYIFEIKYMGIQAAIPIPIKMYEQLQDSDGVFKPI